MKKITALLLCVLMLLPAAGCGNQNSDSGSAATTSSTEKEVSKVATEAVDTSDDALEHLEICSPKFKKYIVQRRTVPITLETTIDNTDGKWESNIYIKDNTHGIIYSKDPAGNETTVIYSGSMVHQIESATRTVYSQELGEDFVTSTIATYMVPLRYSEVLNAVYSNGTGKVEGVEYNCEAIDTHGKDADGNDTVTSHTVYYFDKDTDRLVYIDANNVLTTINVLENKFDRDDLFEVPSDYKTDTIDNLMQQYMDEEAANNSSN